MREVRDISGVKVLCNWIDYRCNTMHKHMEVFHDYLDDIKKNTKIFDSLPLNMLWKEVFIEEKDIKAIKEGYFKSHRTFSAFDHLHFIRRKGK